MLKFIVLNKMHSRLHVVFDEIINYHIVANFGIVQGSALMFRHDVAVCPIFQQEAHYICISPLTSLTKKNNKSMLLLQ